MGLRRGLAPAYHSDKCGWIDKDGSPAIPFRFNECRGMRDGIAAVRVGKAWGYINKQGDFLIWPRYEDAWLFSEGLAPAKKHGKWGFIDRSGERGDLKRQVRLYRPHQLVCYRAVIHARPAI